MKPPEPLTMRLVMAPALLTPAAAKVPVCYRLFVLGCDHGQVQMPLHRTGRRLCVVFAWIHRQMVVPPVSAFRVEPFVPFSWPHLFASRFHEQQQQLLIQFPPSLVYTISPPKRDARRSTSIHSSLHRTPGQRGSSRWTSESLNQHARRC